ncbi:peptidylprolyl isomerase [Novosphingobium sp. ZN18A2]|uniref:peptidylprolyl isomerase n=1 Tax=Novosphingobium sp. ZN18A2 TaxID=3079861 RepID=UPI0030D4A01D
MTLKQGARAMLREPLVHFLLAGAAIFAIWSNVPPDPGERRIVVSEAMVTRLVDRWMETYHRPPTQDEIDGMIRDDVKDQVYYREAQRLGLDRDDEVVIKRMRNKMESLAMSDAQAATPSDAELQALLDKDPAKYAPNPVYAFDQVYLGDDTPANRAAAKTALARLRAGADPRSIGKPIPLPMHFDGVSSADIADQLGDDFAGALLKLPEGQWTGPVTSGVGLHLVRIDKRVLPRKPTLDEVRQRVENDWRSARSKQAIDKAFNEMVNGYDVVIEKPR